MTKTCAVCGKKLGRQSLYTCANCKGIWQTREKEERPCAKPGCAVKFLVGGKGNSKSKRYCSKSCSVSVGNLSRVKPKNLCPICGGPIDNRRRKYRSFECRHSVQNRSKHSEIMLIVARHVPPKLRLIEIPIELLGHNARRQRVFAEQDFACNGCGLSEWRDQPIGLQLEHKDGDRANNVRSNLEGLCGNCHEQTPTWCGRNNSKRVTDDELREAIRQTASLRQALVFLGMADKGGNYKRIKRLAAEMEGRIGVEPMTVELKAPCSTA